MERHKTTSASFRGHFLGDIESLLAEKISKRKIDASLFRTVEIMRIFHNQYAVCLLITASKRKEISFLKTLKDKSWC